MDYKQITLWIKLGIMIQRDLIYICNYYSIKYNIFNKNMSITDRSRLLWHNSWNTLPEVEKDWFLERLEYILNPDT